MFPCSVAQLSPSFCDPIDCSPLQYSCLENPMDGGAWKAAVHGVAEGRTRLNNFTFNFHFHALEKEMATHSSVLAWRIPGMGEPGGLPSMGSHRVRHDWSDLALDCSMPDFPVHHEFLEPAKTHVHRVGDAIQASHCLLSLYPPAFILFKHQGLFQWVSSSHQVDKVLEFQLQHQSFQWIFRTDFLYDGLNGTACSPRGSQESSPTPSILWHSAFFIVQL